MKTFSSLAAVMGLWLAVSFLLWACYRLFRRSDGTKRKRLLSDAAGLIDEGAAVFTALRTRASARVTAEGSYRLSSTQPEEMLKEDVRSLLNGIETQSGYFERVNVLKKKIQKTFDVPDFLALSEILQIRRDFWAASEIFLMDGIQELGPELADTQSFENFQAEARALLFKDNDSLAINPESRDPVELRLAIAREDAIAFQKETERAIAAELEKGRFPTPAELAAVPLSLAKGLYTGLREIRYLIGDAAITAQSIARAMTSKGLKGAAEELRKARTDMPGQFATAFERAGGLARQGGQSLKRHYEFVIEAQELRARYAELLARAPGLSEKGKQFLARLELERRAEQFRETSGDFLDWARQGLVVGIAYLIAGLQQLQAKVTPQSHKQLAPLPAGPSIPMEPSPSVREPESPLRVLLLPASAYSGGNHGRENGAGRVRRTRAASPDTRSKAVPDEAIPAGAPEGLGVRLRDLVTGRATLPSEGPAAKPAKAEESRKQSKPRVSYADGLKKTSLKDLLAGTASEPAGLANEAPGEGETHKTPRGGAGSLLDRLSGIAPEGGDRAASPPIAAERPEGGAKSRGWRFPFGAKRK
jgi:hypothetical protein